MTQNNASSARERLITTPQTGGVTVRLKPQGIADLIAAANGGEIERLQRLLPRLDAEQRPLVIAGLTDKARALLDQPPPRRRGQPAGPSATTSPVAIARGHDQVTQAELARRLGKGDSAVRNAEKRGFDIGLNTLAEYAQGVGASVDVVIRHADGTEQRIPVPGPQAA